MELQNKATSLWGNFFKLGMSQIRAFHMTWFSFFLCFFAWFGIAPLMKVVRDELALTREQVGWCIIFVQMSEGATFSVVPFVNKKALGAVAGIVGAGGNTGAVAARSQNAPVPQPPLEPALT